MPKHKNHSTPASVKFADKQSEYVPNEDELYTMLSGASKLDKDILLTSHGYAFSDAEVHRDNADSITYSCCKSESANCPARVTRSKQKLSDNSYMYVYQRLPSEMPLSHTCSPDVTSSAEAIVKYYRSPLATDRENLALLACSVAKSKPSTSKEISRSQSAMSSTSSSSDEETIKKRFTRSLLSPPADFLNSPYSKIKPVHCTSFNYKLAGRKRTYDSCSDEEDTKSEAKEGSLGDGLKIRDLTKCCLKDCDSLGHLNGKSESHCSLASCPLYHNLTAQICKENSIRWDREDLINEQVLSGEVQRKANTKPTSSMLSYRRQYNRTIGFDGLNLTDVSKTITDIHRNMWKDHERTYANLREPLLDGLASDHDIDLFRKAQSRAADNIGHKNDFTVVQDDSFRIKELVFGDYIMDTCYVSPYPPKYSQVSTIYVCEFCMKPSRFQHSYARHTSKCRWQHPPGDEIYRNGNMSVFEIDGKKNKIYCQNLCLLAKLFLNHKTLYFAVEPFLFYVFTEVDETGAHIVGYFSKEKISFNNYNLSCILTLPPYMRQGYGRIFIDFSYLLSKMEGKLGSPERPLSDLGLTSYRSYWKKKILGYLSGYDSKDISIKDISSKTGIHSNDIISTFQSLGMVKYWKGKHLILKRNDLIDEWLENEKKLTPEMKSRCIDSNALRWTPNPENE